jgi:CBS domain-containing protein
MQARDAMTRDVTTIAPDGLVKRAAELMAGKGFTALPVVDAAGTLVGMVSESDVLRNRLPPDPRLHLLRDGTGTPSVPGVFVRNVMTSPVRSVEASADVADVARMFVDQHLRSVPVLEDGRTVGIVSRRDLLRTLARPDADIRADLLRLVEDYTGESGCWDVDVSEGAATFRRTHGAAEVPVDIEQGAFRELAATVGVVMIRFLEPPAGTSGTIDSGATS